MSWSDIFYPGNARKREQVVSLSTKLHTLMEFNFEATNDLIDLLNKDASPSSPISKISVDSNATIKVNCQTLLDKMDEVMAVVDTIDEELSKQLDPEIYRQLKAPDLKFSERIALAKKAVSAGLSVAATVAGITLIALIKTGIILANIVKAIGYMKTCAVAALLLGVLVMGIDMIASAIIGSIEEDKLEDAVDDLEKALETFEPASKEYTKTITRVEIYLEMMIGDTDF